MTDPVFARGALCVLAEEADTDGIADASLAGPRRCLYASWDLIVVNGADLGKERSAVQRTVNIQTSAKNARFPELVEFLLDCSDEGFA